MTTAPVKPEILRSLDPVAAISLANIVIQDEARIKRGVDTCPNQHVMLFLALRHHNTPVLVPNEWMAFNIEK
jgi:hypothetical protein